MGPCLRWAWRFCATCAPVNLALRVCMHVCVHVCVHACVYVVVYAQVALGHPGVKFETELYESLVHESNLYFQATITTFSRIQMALSQFTLL